MRVQRRFNHNHAKAGSITARTSGTLKTPLVVSSVQGSGGEPQLCIYSQSPPAPCFTTFARQQGISSNQRRTLTTPPVPQAHAVRGRGVHLLDSSLRCLAGAGLLNGVFIYRSYASFPCPAFMFIEFVLIVWAVWSYI